jgi:tetratricopeptide (TPR) repeat protein
MTDHTHDSLNMENLRKQAKSLLQAVRSGNADALARIRRSHPEFGEAPIVPEKFRLADAQLVIARENGSASWPRLKKSLDRKPSAALPPADSLDTHTVSARMAELFHRFQEKVTAPHRGDRAELHEAHRLVEALLVDQVVLDKELVSLAHKVCYWLGDLDTLVRLHRKYLQQPLLLDEEYSSRNEVVTSLAMLKRHRECVDEGELFYEWAKEHLPAARLPSVLNCATPAMSWPEVGRGEDWLKWCAEMLRLAPATEGNRMERFYLLRTRGHIQGILGKWDDALANMDRISALAGEDPQWPQRHSVLVRSISEAIRIHKALGNRQGVSRSLEQGQKLIAEIDTLMAQSRGPDQQDFLICCDNLGHALYDERRYEEAIPVLRRSLGPVETNLNAYGTQTLAAVVWAASKDRAETFALLEHAMRVGNAGSRADIMNVPEFVDLHQDPEFMALARS